MYFETIERNLERLTYILTSVISVLIGLFYHLKVASVALFVGVFFLLWVLVFFVVSIVRIVVLDLLYRCMVDDDEFVNQVQLPIISMPDEECSICLESCDHCVKLECGHYFHVECINSWLEEQGMDPSCPNCRAQIV
jgi:hypothetical protein